MNDDIETTSCIVTLRSDGIVEVKAPDDHTCTLETARLTATRIAAISGGKPVAVLHIAGAHTQIEEGVREFHASPECQKNILAEAFVVRTLAQRLIGNFYLKINRPAKPARLFDTIEEAEAWLKMQMNLHTVHLS